MGGCVAGGGRVWWGPIRRGESGAREGKEGLLGGWEGHAGGCTSPSLCFQTLSTSLFTSPSPSHTSYPSPTSTHTHTHAHTHTPTHTHTHTHTPTHTHTHLLMWPRCSTEELPGTTRAAAATTPPARAELTAPELEGRTAAGGPRTLAAQAAALARTLPGRGARALLFTTPWPRWMSAASTRTTCTGSCRC